MTRAESAPAAIACSLQRDGPMQPLFANAAKACMLHVALDELIASHAGSQRSCTKALRTLVLHLHHPGRNKVRKAGLNRTTICKAARVLGGLTKLAEPAQGMQDPQPFRARELSHHMCASPSLSLSLNIPPEPSVIRHHLWAGRPSPPQLHAWTRTRAYCRSGSAGSSGRQSGTAQSPSCRSRGTAPAPYKCTHICIIHVRAGSSCVKAAPPHGPVGICACLGLALPVPRAHASSLMAGTAAFRRVDLLPCARQSIHTRSTCHWPLATATGLACVAPSPAPPPLSSHLASHPTPFSHPLHPAPTPFSRPTCCMRPAYSGGSRSAASSESSIWK